MGFPYRKTLCPIDFDQNSLAALDKAIELAHHFNAAMAVVHVIPMIVQYGEGATPAETHQSPPQIYAQHENEARAELTALTEKNSPESLVKRSSTPAILPEVSCSRSGGLDRIS